MRVLTVFAHPDRRSFCGAVLDRSVFGAFDGAFFADDSVPDAVLEQMELRDRVIQSAGGPLRQAA